MKRAEMKTKTNSMVALENTWQQKRKDVSITVVKMTENQTTEYKLTLRKHIQRITVSVVNTLSRINWNWSGYHSPTKYPKNRRFVGHNLLFMNYFFFRKVIFVLPIFFFSSLWSVSTDSNIGLRNNVYVYYDFYDSTDNCYVIINRSRRHILKLS